MFKSLTTTILGILFFCLSAQNSQAQNEIHDAGVIFASEFCKCINPHLKGLDPKVVEVLMGLPDDPDQTETYLAGFDADVLTLFVEQMATLEAFGESEEYLGCMAKIEEKLERFKDKLESFYDDPAFLQAVLDDLEGSSKCQLAYLFLKIGLTAQE